MIPLKDNIPSRRFPVVNIVLIALNVAAFFYELQLGGELDRFFLQFGIVPLRYQERVFFDQFSLVEQALPFFTSMFLHGGWLHLIGNVWFLWIFGDNVEDRLGRGRYLLFYLLCGLSAGIIHTVSVIVGVEMGMLSVRQLGIPTIGASGAIAGVMGAYFVSFPRARVLTLVPIFIFAQLMELPAFIFLGIWFAIQFFSGSFSLLGGVQSYGGVAWWAHIGGFAAGALLVKLFQRRR